MAVTRINNNQITAAVDGNAYLGINAASKLQNYSITSNKIANSLVYGSDLTVSGNLTVNGTTTTVDTVNTLIKDPILTLADGQTAGTPVVDIGILGLRGNQLSSFLGWNEANTEFAAVLTSTTASNTTVTITQYGNFHANNITAQGNLSVVGNIIGDISFSGNITAGNLFSTGIVSATSNVIGGNVLTGGLVSATANVTGGNLLTGGLISATSTITSAANITGGNLLTGGLVSATANVTGGNILTAGLVSATANVTGGNILTGGLISATSTITSAANITGGNLLTGGLVSATANVTGGNLLTAGIVSATSNITGGNLLTSGLISATSTITSAANITGGNLLTGGLVSATANVTGGNLLTGGLISAAGNITGSNINGTLYGNVNATIVSATSNITGGNILTGGLISATANVTGGNILTGGLISATSTITSSANITGGNLLTGGLISATANVTGGNILTGGLISASGNITSATNVNTPNVVATGNLELSGGNILLTPTANVVLNNTYINGLAQPVQNNDAASKIYVDNMVSTQIAYHQAVQVATTANLATTTGGTITYNQPNGAGNGIGATITTTGSFNLIDTANVQTANTRILVKDEGNAVLNGVYVWSNATVITRSTDADVYGPNSAEELSINDYFFVQNGNVNKGSAYIVDAPSGTITFGTSNISFAQFSSSQTYTAGNGISLYGTVISTVYDNSTIGVNGSNQLYIPANAPLVTPNIGAATGTSLSVTGAITAGTTLSSVGNTIAGNVLTAGYVSATGNVTGGNVLTGGLVSATANVTGGNLLTGGLVSATANVTGGNILTGGLISATSTITSAANITGGNLLTGGLVSATANVTGGNLLTGGLVSATANVTGGNILTGGLISATANVTGGNLLTGGLISATSTITSAANITGGNILTGGLISATSTITSAANITGGNLLTGGLISATANVTGGNLLTGGVVSATANITGGNVLTGGLVSATANVIGGNLTTGGLVSATANVTGGNLLTGGLVSATANVTGGNINTAGLVSATGNIYAGNLILAGAALDTTAGRLTVNSTSADADFAINADTVANVFYVDAGNGTAAFGSSQTYVNAIVSMNATTSMLLPTGTTGQRPSNASSVTGMIRFNSTNNGLEVFDNAEWTPVGTTTFTVIADEQFNGDGATVAFTLASTQTTNSCIVSINGIVQIPGTAYSVAGTAPTCVLTFTEAPAVGDLIDVREITTTTTVTAISNNSGNAQITGSPTAADLTVLGNLVPTANVTYSLGDSTHYWKSLYVGGNTIYLGGLQLQSAAGNVFTVTTDGSTPANLNVQISTTGNVYTGNIVNTNANGVGNIGSSTTYFNTVFAKATSAQYADLAEKYVADAEYAPGTVLSFGGDKEVTQSAKDSDRAVAGVVSTNPSYIMNAALDAEYVATIALTGRVPTSVTGTVAKGDLMVSNGDGTARAEEDPKAGTIIGKALENFDGKTGVIEVVIGRF